jgi:hypothetical protein
MDLQTYQLVDMSLADGYTFALGQNGARFRVYLGDDRWLATHLQPEGVAAGWPFPNPTAGPVTIPLALPPADEPWQVQTSILNLSGQEQVSLPAVIRKPGLGEIVWDGQLADGHRLPAGVYIIRIQVTGQGQTYPITRKLVVAY